MLLVYIPSWAKSQASISFDYFVSGICLLELLDRICGRSRGKPDLIRIDQFSYKKVEKMSKIVEVMANLLTQGRLNFTVN